MRDAAAKRGGGAGLTAGSALNGHWNLMGQGVAKRNAEHGTGRPPAAGAKMPDIMTPAEAAQFMKVTEEDILAAITDGSLKAKKVGKAYRISKDNP